MKKAFNKNGIAALEAITFVDSIVGQYHRLLALLIKHGEINTLHPRDEVGCMRNTGRVHVVSGNNCHLHYVQDRMRPNPDYVLRKAAK